MLKVNVNVVCTVLVPHALSTTLSSKQILVGFHVSHVRSRPSHTTHAISAKRQDSFNSFNLDEETYKRGEGRYCYSILFLYGTGTPTRTTPKEANTTFTYANGGEQKLGHGIGG